MSEEIYENKKTGKTGKIVERNEKYKTLILELSDGQRIPMSNSVFRSNWHLIENSESVKEPTDTTEDVAPDVTPDTVAEPVSEETVEETVETATVEEPKKDKRNRKIGKRKQKMDMQVFFDEMIPVFNEYIDSFHNPRLHITSYINLNAKKYFVKILMDKKCYIEYHFRTMEGGSFWVRVPSAIYNNTKFTAKPIDVKTNTKYFKDINFYIRRKDINKNLDDFREVLIELLCADRVENYEED